MEARRKGGDGSWGTERRQVREVERGEGEAIN